MDFNYFIFYEQQGKEEQEDEEGCDEPATEEVDKGGKFSKSIFNSVSVHSQKIHTKSLTLKVSFWI